IEDPGTLVPALAVKGMVFRDMGRINQASDLLKETIQTIERVRGQIPLTMAKANYLQERIGVYDNLIELLIRTGNNSEAFHYVERAKARAFLDLLTEARNDIRKKIDPQLLKRERFALAKWLYLQSQLQAAASKEKATESLREQVAHAE